MGLGRSDKAKLTAALESLPTPIAWLRDPILDIAKQDQDLLGCGEADPAKLIRSLCQHAEDAPEVFTDAADALREWMNGQGDVNSAWAGPIWFVEGFVRGCDMFGADAAALAEPPPKRPPLGLKTIALDIPSGMKSKLYVGGVEMKDRTVQIIIAEVDEATYEIQSTAFKAPASPTMEQVPHLRVERDAAFTIGRLTGVKMAYRHTQTGLVVMAMYMLALDNLHIDASIFSKKLTGCEIGPYEQILATIRRR